MDIFMKIYFLALYFFVYGFLGWCTEVAFAGFKERHFVNRGFLNGPICPIYGAGVSLVILFLTPLQDHLLLLYIASVLLVTLLEGLTGWAMDKIFHNKWWDYSNMPFNIGGYVCLLFSLIWGVACVAIMEFIHPLIHKLLTFLPRPLGIGLIVIFTIILFADLYVTASEIFKFNRKLEAMEKIAQELHEISDQIGSDIYEKTVLAMETASDIKEKHRETLDELKERQQQALDELKERQLQALDELKEKNELLQERRDAFKEHLEDLRETAGDFADRIDFCEFTEDLRDRSMELSEDMKTRISALRLRYQELEQKPDRVARRLLRAFPRQESRNHKERVEKLKEKLLKK